MNNLREKILQALQNNGRFDMILKDLKISQDNLLKNYSNPAFSDNDKNKILQEYNKIEELGKSISQYSTLKENGLLEDAETEKRKILDKILYGTVTNPKYIWHSEENPKTCGKCRSLNNSLYYMSDEVPQRPHPNCRCTVEVEEEKKLETPKSETKKQENSHPGWIMPCSGPITSYYGKRVAPVPGASNFHNGWDIGVDIGTPIKAIADGKIIAVGADQGYGNWVVIDHGIINGKRVTSEYGHISSSNVTKEQYVKQGQIIAISGNEGISSGPHLHITIREGTYQGQAIDPDKYIKF
ncbi:MAG: peptidoglycan DD-metalloendopeptidase family protein [Muribaculaceae bacterium]|nr:peptidoglycan DD-metalloendopeptidase family protein [Muribaculaceae bacterium]